MPATILSIPLELREIIYEHLFSTYVVRHGFGQPSSENRAALLQTCKQIYVEAWQSLPRNVSFHFRGTETMLNSLMDVDQAIVTRIRHVRVKSFPFPLYFSGTQDFYSTYYFHNALSLFPGLCLEQLVVEDSFHGAGLVDTWRDIVTYFDFEALLKSNGWEELVYTTPCTDFITSGYDHKRKRVEQPGNWNATLQERDGEASGAEVQMYITPHRKSSEDEKNMPQPWAAKPGHEVIENFRIAEPDQDLKGEVRIVARRGRKAKCSQTGVSARKNWKELKDKEGGFKREDWTPYYNDMADAVSWIYGGWGRRMQLANMALNH